MVPPPPPPLSDELPCWWDEVWASPVDVRRRIFCNRSLNMQHIKVPTSHPTVAMQCCADVWPCGCQHIYLLRLHCWIGLQQVNTCHFQSYYCVNMLGASALCGSRR